MSTIEQIEVRVVAGDYRVRWTDEADACHVSTTIVQVTDSDGLHGAGGVGSYTPAAVDLTVFEAVRALAPALVGRELSCRETMADEFRVGVVFPFLTSPLAILDVAIWDIEAQCAGLPLYQLLGGARDRIPAYASLETMPLESQYLDVVETALDEGLKAVKVHAWGDAVRDVALLRKLRSEHSGLELMYDAEGVYDRRLALWVGRQLDEIGCRWFEAPLNDFDLVGYRELRHRLDVPVLPAGYAMWDVRQFSDALRDPPWDAARADLTSTTGITTICKLMALAEAHDMDLEPVSYGHSFNQVATLHVMLGRPNVTYFELPYPTAAWEFGVTNPLRPEKDGTVGTPREPGLGLSVDWERMDSSTVAKSIITT